jgi:hypothetical protein
MGALPSQHLQIKELPNRGIKGQGGPIRIATGMVTKARSKTMRAIRMVGVTRRVTPSGAAMEINLRSLR